MRRLYSRLPRNTSIISQTVFDDPRSLSVFPHGCIARWKVKEGDEVRREDILVEVSVDKNIIEVKAKVGGRIARTIGKEGDEVDTRQSIVVIYHQLSEI